MYHEFATDPKIQRLSESNQRRFVMLLCLRCCNGDVTLQNEDVTFQLRISDEEWTKTRELFLSIGLINDQNLPCAWDKRQKPADSSTERVRRFRNKHETLQKRYSNALDIDKEEEKERKDMLKESFLLFWENYPKKKAKADAEKAFLKLSPDQETMNRILSAIEQQKESADWKKDGGQFIPYPATWIRARRWEDQDEQQGGDWQ
jgi:hypothetical protein